MSFPYTPRLEDEKLESLQTQYEYLKLLRLRHLQWMSSADDRESKSTHKQVADQLQEIIDRYSHLFKMLRQ